MTIDLAGSPYSLDETGRWVLDKVGELHRRVEMLRAEGRLTEETLRAFFGDKRFEQITESNAIEGSTLDVGETRMAVLKGMTVTGHDPAYSRDAVNLAAALDRMVELAGISQPVGIDEVKELHSLILGDVPGAGVFRSEPVRISGSPHTPPANWQGVMSGMEDWERWSAENGPAPAMMRAIVLHAWLTHVHPFTDGNGRTARAVMNLELIRGGLPSLIIRKKDRLRYYEALAESDLGGDLGLVAELLLARAEDALRDLERAAAAQQGYDRLQSELRQAQARQVGIWNDAVRLLFSIVDDTVQASLGELGTVSTHWYEDELLLDDYVALAQGDSAGNSWLFRLEADVPGVGDRRYLAWTGFRSYGMQDFESMGAGPSIFWSVPDPSGDRKWARNDNESPGVAELTLQLPEVDRWIGRLPNGEIVRLQPSAVGRRVAEAISRSLTNG